MVLRQAVMQVVYKQQNQVGINSKASCHKQCDGNVRTYVTERNCLDSMLLCAVTACSHVHKYIISI